MICNGIFFIMHNKIMIHYCMIIIIVNLRFFFEFVNKVLLSLQF